MPIIINQNKLITNNNYLPLAFFAFTFAVGLLFNLVLNPFKPELYSDLSQYMDGYVTRADLLLANPFSKNSYLTFFPPGTDIILALMKLIFGKNNYIAIDVLYAFLGAGSVAFAYCIAESVSRFKAVPIMVGLLAMINLNFYVINSFFISQTPYCFFMMAGIWSLFKLIDHGKIKHTLLTGLFFGIASLIRPEILVFLILLLTYILLKNKYFSSINFNLNFKRLFSITLVFSLCILLASTKFFIHSNKLGLISENFSYNLVFGRCHNVYLYASNDYFFSPAMKYLNTVNDTFIKLDPALDITIKYEGKLNDTKKHFDLISQCINKTGWIKQIHYSIINMLLLWLTPLWMLGKTLSWLDSLWSTFFIFYFMIPSFISLLLLFNIFSNYKNNIKLNLISLIT